MNHATDDAPALRPRLRHQLVYVRMPLPGGEDFSRLEARTVLTFEARELPAQLSLHARYLNILSINFSSLHEQPAVACQWQLNTDHVGRQLDEQSVKEWMDGRWRVPELTIDLPPIPPSSPSSASAHEERAKFSLHIHYQICAQLSPDNDPTLGGRNPALICSAEMVAVLPVGDLRLARYWLPCVDDMATLCNWDIQLDLAPPEATSGLDDGVAKNWTVVGSGQLISDQVLVEDGVRSCQFRLSNRPAGLVGLVVGDLASGPPVASVPSMVCVLTARNRTNRLSPVVDFISRAVHYPNWYLTQGSNGVAVDFPFAPPLSIVFSRQLPTPLVVLANVLLVSMELLADASVIDQTWEMRRRVCEGLAWQYWWLPTAANADAWLTVSLRDFLVRQQLRIFHGHNDYRFRLRRDLQRVLDFEQTNPNSSSYALHDPQRSELEALVPGTHLRLKGVLVLNLLEQRLGKANFQRLLTHVYVEAQNYINRHAVSGEVMREKPLSTISFFRSAKRLSGKDLRSFIEQWVYDADSLPRFRVAYTYNRTRSVIEVHVEEALRRRLHGSVLVRVHEGEGGGTFDHVVHVDDPMHRFDLPYHSRARKPRVPKVKAERTVLDSINPPSHQDSKAGTANSNNAGQGQSTSTASIRWVRIDPDGEWLASFQVEQSDTQWADQLEYDRDVVAQFEAVRALQTQFVALSEATLSSLERVILDPKIFYAIRCMAAVALSNSAVTVFDDDNDCGVGVRLGDVHRGTPMAQVRKLLEIYAKRHAHRDLATNEVMPRANNFDVLPTYFVQRALMQAIGCVRDANNGGRPLEPIVRFLSDFLRLNDNTTNAYSDAYYVSDLIRGLCQALPAVPNANLVEEGQGQVERYARRDRLLPSHRNLVMQTIARHYGRFQAAADFYRCPEHHWEIRWQCFLRLVDAGEMDMVAGLLQDNWQLYYACVATCRRCLPDGNLWAEALVVRGDLEKARTLPRAVASEAEQPTSSKDWLQELTIPAPSSSLLPTPPVPPTTEEKPRLRLKLALKTPASGARNGGEFGRLALEALEALEAVWQSPDSYPFRFPVDPSVPLYYTIIRQPMDLSTVRAKLEQNDYPGGHLDAVLRDLRLIIDNCAAFNVPGSPIVRQSQHLAKLAAAEFRARFPAHAKLIRQVLKGSRPDDHFHNHQHHQETVTLPVPVVEQQPPEEDVDVIDPYPGNERDLDGGGDYENGAGAYVHSHSHEGGDEEEIIRQKPLTWKQMRYLLRKLQEHPDSFWFREPVDAVALGLSTYHDVIREPMDLGTVGTELASRERDIHHIDDDDRLCKLNNYADEFIRRVLLVFDNCLTFNAPDTLVHLHGRQLRALFLAWLRDDHLLALVERQSPQPQSLALQVEAPKADNVTVQDGLPENLCILLTACIEDLMAHPRSEPFNGPVDWRRLGLPQYPRLIKRPMDFGTIRQKLNDRHHHHKSAKHGQGRRRPYQSADDFVKDVEQVFGNCLKFNGPTADISQWVCAVQAHFERNWLARIVNHRDAAHPHNSGVDDGHNDVDDGDHNDGDDGKGDDN